MTSREILASQRILKPAVSTVASSVERTGIEPVTSGLQTQPIARPHLTPTDRIGMSEPYSAICRTSPDTVRRRSARTALARPVPTWATIVRSSRTRARQSGEGGDRPPLYHALQSATSRNPRQRFWRDSAAFAAARFATACHRFRSCYGHHLFPTPLTRERGALRLVSACAV
jgi:hypothetical protein